MFIDQVKVHLKAGNGGNGIVSFRREAHVPLGGPYGGDGGKGGDIIFEVDTNKSTLLDLRYNKKIVAQNGEQGKNKKMHGADGKSIVIKVPLGTVIKNDDTGFVIADLKHVGQRVVVAKGGKGGRGNYHFKSAKNPAPEYAEKGEAGDDLMVKIELKLLADVGLVGFPSVGKSTLLSVVTAARPEIADYHFTTLVPNLGVVKVKDGRSFVMADLPGLINGASQGKGLGIQFLRHIERCRVIMHVVDMGAVDGRDPVQDFKDINAELESYHYRLMERPQIVIANKMDMEEAEANLARFQKEFPDITVYPACTLINEGLEQALYKVADLLEVTPEFPIHEEEDTGVLYAFTPNEPDFTIQNLGNGRWNLQGPKIDKLFDQTDFEKEESVRRFGNLLREIGVDAALREKGCMDGDLVAIRDFEFVFEE
ncbi:MAG: GTPase ObgE [Erysipelotrichaceae bacterium]|nr:GTPase ObgE [Erysipelotrichaceae bacterium]